VPPPPIVPCPVIFTQPGRVIGEGVADRYTLTAEGDATRQTAPPSIFADVDADATFEIVTFP